MDYLSALRVIHERSDYERGFISNPFAGDEAASIGIVRIRRALMELGNPDRRYPIIHVAGTKGKGSTCAMIEAVTRRNGLKTGLYTTPHLHTFRERIRINGEPVDQQIFAGALEKTLEAEARVEERLPQLGRMTAYELTTTMTFLLLAEQGIDLGIIEVGLGGRLDGTNVVAADVSAITSISFDHMAILGETLPEIASEKAGIIKPGQTVVLGPQQEEAIETVTRIARERGAWLLREDADWTATYQDGLTRLTGPWGTLPAVQLGLAGAHQTENAGAALAALWAFDPLLVDDLTVVREALTEVTWPGRFEIVDREPPTVIDGAHNVDSIRRLVEALQERFPDKQPAVIFGSSADKDIGGMLAALASIQPEIHVIESHSQRAATGQTIRERAAEAGIDIEIQPSLEDALGATSDAELIVITGSLYVVAEAREALGLAQPDDEERAIFAQ